MRRRFSTPYKFHVDSCLGGRSLIERVTLLEGETMRSHVGVFPDGTADVEWLGAVSREGWVILTSDVRMQNRSAELDEIARNGGVAVFFPSRLTDAQLVPTIEKALVGIRGHLEGGSAPFTVRLDPSTLKGPRKKLKPGGTR